MGNSSLDDSGKANKSQPFEGSLIFDTDLDGAEVREMPSLPAPQVARLRRCSAETHLSVHNEVWALSTSTGPKWQKGLAPTKPM